MVHCLCDIGTGAGGNDNVKVAKFNYQDTM